jgi:NitT/TauT family transport system ATP-binding protein
MAAGGVDPDEDVRLVVLPPPYMVESLVNGHVDAFCVGAPWNSVAVDLGAGRILHFGSEILARAAEKVLAVRARWAAENPEVLSRLLRVLARASAYIAAAANREEVAALLAAPARVAVDAEVIRRTLDGHMRVAPDGSVRTSDRYLIIGRKEAGFPEPLQAAWLYAQMVRWRQAPFSAEHLAAAKAVFRCDLLDAAVGARTPDRAGEPSDGIGAFTGPAFDGDELVGQLAGWNVP